MDTRSKRLVGTAVVAAAFIGALTYAAYRYRHTATASAAAPRPDGVKRETPTKLNAATSKGAYVGAEQRKATVTLPPESPHAAAERAKALELLDMLKQQANLAFQESRYEDAIKRYQDCLEVTAALGAHDAEAVKVDQVVRANVIMTFIRMHDYDAARFVATMILQDGGVPLPEDLKVKVLYRRGLASKSLGDKDAALADFQAAVHFSPNQKNPAAGKEIELIEKAR